MITQDQLRRELNRRGSSQPEWCSPTWIATFVDGTRLPCRGWTKSEARADLKRTLGLGRLPHGTRLVREEAQSHVA
jgi:hypothetical protein